MKKTFLFVLATLVLGSIVITGCKKDKDQDENPTGNIIPSTFKVDIPDAISHPFSGAKSVNYKGVMTDTIPGDVIYEHLANFIYIGEEAAQIIQDIMTFIAVYNINHPIDFTYTGEEDGRDKHMVVIENSSYDGINYEYQMTVTDADYEGNADGGKAVQVFWNTSPVKGVAIIKPANFDVNSFAALTETMYRVDYSEAGELDYEKYMVVYIANLPLENPLTNPYSMQNLKMFAGKDGDVIDVWGNSDHPNAKFYNDDVGFDWAFVASGIKTENIGVAEVGIPRRTLDSSDRTALLVTNSIKNVLSAQIYEVWPTIDSASVEAYLHNTDAPGYFNSGGFVQGGASPGTQYDNIDSRLPGLSPYNPFSISNLSIEFK
ncbi:MAG: hypothetical protein JXR58_07715 [Bacteroidales bacterium]|nr:hypothetical protein [Bacteroidales bacterium]